jgi:hypothetical protein
MMTKLFPVNEDLLGRFQTKSSFEMLLIDIVTVDHADLQRHQFGVELYMRPALITAPATSGVGVSASRSAAAAALRVAADATPGPGVVDSGSGWAAKSVA